MTTDRILLRGIVPVVALGVALSLLLLPEDRAGSAPVPEDANRGVLLASSRTLPDGQRRDIAVLVSSRRSFRRTWRQFDLEGAPMIVDFDRRKVLFAGTGESGTCPEEYRALERVEGRRLVKVHIKVNWGDVCTDDFNPRTFVVAARKANFPRGEFEVRIGFGKKIRVRRR